MSLWLVVLMRWMHILGAIILVGSAVFYWRSILPALTTSSDSDRNSIWAAIRPRWSQLVMISVMLLLLSGIVNIVLMVKSGEFKELPPGLYHGLLLVKILLALVVFFLMSVITGRSSLAQKLQKNMAKWTAISVLIAIVIVCIAGIMKSLPRTEVVPEKSAVSLRSHPMDRGSHPMDLEPRSEIN